MKVWSNLAVRQPRLNSGNLQKFPGGYGPILLEHIREKGVQERKGI